MQNSTLGRSIDISEDDLPFSCPPPKAPKWNMHPRVMIQISRQQPQKSCPYCGATYQLVTSDSNADNAGDSDSDSK